MAGLCAARAYSRARAWAAGAHPDPELLIVDADATLVLAHSDAKEGAAGTCKGSFGFHPLELRHRQRGRIEDCIRAAKATGLQNLPFDRRRCNSV